jgi:GWxTD domain-containing protein
VLTELDTGHETLYEGRLEAKRMLDRAYRLMGQDPELLLEYGLLLRKKQIRNDARRVLNLAWESAEARGRELAPADRARFHYALGRYYEEYNQDWQDLVMLPPTAPQLNCDGIVGAHPSHCPEAWLERIEAAVPIEGLNDDDRRRMLGHFERALEADPGHVDAARSLLSYLANEGQWERYDEVAERFLAAAPEEARAHLIWGLGRHERGRDEEAGVALLRGISLLDEEERRVFDDIAPLLPKRERDGFAGGDERVRAEVRRVWYTAKDPLFLTEVNERELEHYARLAWAELNFAEPGSGHTGWESDRGRIWIRYGRPVHSTKCCYGSGGRAIHWSYGPLGPVFSFSKLRTRRTAYHTDLSHYFAAELEVDNPELYLPTMVTEFVDIPHQIVRFRGSRPDLTRVEIYAAPSAEALEAEPGDVLETGIFTFLKDYTPVWERRVQAPVTPAGVALTYRFELAPGWYRYGVEARTEGPDDLARPAARLRSSVETAGFSGRLAISDLLMAEDTVRPRVPDPTRRDDLVVRPLRTTTVEVGAPIHLYFEVYGLTPDDDGYGRYTAEVALEDSTRRNFAEKIYRGALGILGLDAPETRVRWDRETRVVGDLVPEYVSLEASGVTSGEYLLRVRLTDAATGRQTESARRVRVVGAGTSSSPPQEDDDRAVVPDPGGS